MIKIESFNIYSGETLRMYKLNTVTYGTSTAPYLAIRSLIHLAHQYSDKFKLDAEAIKSSFDVDNFNCGANTVNNLREIKVEVIEILRRGGVALAK